MTTKDRDALVAENDELLRELQLYKSVAVPADFRPRSTLTRVARKPLMNQSMNTRPPSTGLPRSGGKKLETTAEDEYKDGDMTLDELS